MRVSRFSSETPDWCAAERVGGGSFSATHSSAAATADGPFARAQVRSTGLFQSSARAEHFLRADSLSLARDIGAPANWIVNMQSAHECARARKAPRSTLLHPFCMLLGVDKATGPLACAGGRCFRLCLKGGPSSQSRQGWAGSDRLKRQSLQ